MFVLEALNADKGDCLLVHCGAEGKPWRMLVDGGPDGTWESALCPVLQALVADGTPLYIALAMVTHVDDDHINGMIDLTRDMIDRREASRPKLCSIGTFWHNHFDDIIGNRETSVLFEADGADAAIASIGQGRDLRANLDALNLLGNKPFNGLVTARKEQFERPSGPKLIVLGPLPHHLTKLEAEWDKALKKGVKKEAATAALAAYGPTTVPNRSSLVVLVEQEQQRMLLTGDARGDDILKGLEVAEIPLPLDVQILKMPHHGSRHAVCDDFLRQVRAQHYVFSFSSKATHGHPNPETIDALLEVRNDDDFALHFTNRHSALEKQINGYREKGRTFRVVFRDPAAHSMRICI